MRSVLVLALGVCALGETADEALARMKACKAAPVILKDTATGWKDDCKGLDAANPNLAANDATTADACKAACYATPSCAVWQFHESKCYTGVPLGACRSDRMGTQDFTAVGQRVQHGTIKKTGDALGMEVMGLATFKMASGDEAMDQERCKNQCYSDVTCGVWQFAEQTEGGKGCWVENAKHRQTGEKKTDTEFAKTVKFGEFVEHVCPPPAKPEDDNTWLYALIAGLVALLLVAVLCYMMQKKPKQKKTRAVKIEPKKEEPVQLFIPQPTILIQQPQLVYQQVPQVAVPQTAVVAQPTQLVSQPLLGGSSVVYR